MTSQRHEEITLDDHVSYQLLRILDGTRDGAALLSELQKLADEAVLVIQVDGQSVRDPAQRQQMLQDALARNLDRLVRAGLLIA